MAWPALAECPQLPRWFPAGSEAGLQSRTPQQGLRPMGPDSALWASGLHPTCLVPLVAAAPFVPTEDARVVGAQQAGVVDADLP